MGDFGDWMLALAAVVFGATGVWTWMINARAATSKEYKDFVEDLRQERRDRETAIKELRTTIRQQDARIYNQALMLADLEIHVERLESVIEDMGGTPPPRPPKRETPVSPPDPDTNTKPS